MSHLIPKDEKDLMYELVKFMIDTKDEAKQLRDMADMVDAKAEHLTFTSIARKFDRNPHTTYRMGAKYRKELAIRAIKAARKD